MVTCMVNANPAGRSSLARMAASAHPSSCHLIPSQARARQLVWVQCNLLLQKKIGDVDYMEEPIHHDLAESLLEDDGAEVVVEDEVPHLLHAPYACMHYCIVCD